MEHAFKALITADGRRIEHTHDLDTLWQQAEESGERIGAMRNSDQLQKPSRYAGDGRYQIPIDEDASVTWSENRTTGEDVLNHARQRVPQADRADAPGAREPDWRRDHRRRGVAGSGNAAGPGAGSSRKAEPEPW